MRLLHATTTTFTTPFQEIIHMGYGNVESKYKFTPFCFKRLECNAAAMVCTIVLLTDSFRLVGLPPARWSTRVSRKAREGSHPRKSLCLEPSARELRAEYMIPEGTRDAEPIFCVLEVVTQVVPLHRAHSRTSVMLRCGSAERPSPIEHPSVDKLATLCGQGKLGLCNGCEADLESSRQRPAGGAVVQVVVREVVADVAEQGAAKGATTRPVREAQPEKRPKLHHPRGQARQHTERTQAVPRR
jgi:hypothetical protein